MQQEKEAQIALDEQGIINHDSPVPYYYQLAQYMERKIKSKQWLPHQVLPSEQEICAQLGISRTVVRQAMNYLVNERLVIKQNGKRSCIAGLKYSGNLMQNLRGFYEDAVAQDRVPTSKVLDFRVIDAHDDIAEKLCLNEGEPVIKLERIRYLDGEPTIHVITYLPEHMCPSLIHEDFSLQSLYETLEKKYHLVVAEGVRTIEAISTTQIEAQLLDIPVGTPLLLLTSVGYLKNGVPLEYYIAKHRGDRSKFQVHIVRD